MCPGRALGLAWKGHLSVRGYLGLGLGPARMWAWLHVKASPGVIFEGPAASLGTSPYLVLEGALLGLHTCLL